MNSIQAKWTQDSKVQRVMAAVGCDMQTAREYLLAEEGDERDAIISYRADHA